MKVFELAVGDAARFVVDGYDAAVTPLDPEDYRDIVRRALEEDLGAGDVTTAPRLPAAQRAAASSSSRRTACWRGSTSRSRRFRQLDASVASPAETRRRPLCAVATRSPVVRLGAGAADRRANRAQLSAAALRHRHAGARIRRCRRRPHHRARHAQDDADAPRAREVRRRRGRRHEPSLRPVRRAS